MPDPNDPTANRTARAPRSADSSVASGGGGETRASPTGHTTPARPQFGPAAFPNEVGTLGSYRVLRELGKGGMGAVYLATDMRLNRKVALKVMLPEYAADAQAKERFLREARAAAQISHDNVVTVYEADEREGVPYIAMQFLQGEPLDQFLKRTGAPGGLHVLRIGADTATGLSAAHALGLVHRDIKPANIWLEAPSGRTKILDFGLARPAGAASELTNTGAVVGTPAYMSPEQARGAKVDHRTDLFSLGVVLYRLAAGQNPFRGPNMMSVLLALSTEDPAPVRELNPQVPSDFADLIHQLLAKDPDHRPQSAADVARRCRATIDRLAGAVTAPHTVAAPPAPGDAFADLEETESDPAPEAVPEPKRAARGLWLAAAGLTALLLAAAAVALVARSGGRGEPNPAAPPAAPAPVAEKRPDVERKGTADEERPAAERAALGRQYNRLGEEHQAGRNGAERNPALAREWYQKSADLGFAEGQYNLAYTYKFGIGGERDEAKAHEWFMKARPGLEKAPPGNGDPYNYLGAMYYYGWGGEKDYTKARAWYEKAAAQGHYKAQSHLGDMYHAGVGVPVDYAQAKAWYEKAAAQGHAQAQNVLGRMYHFGRGIEVDYGKAKAWYERAAAQGHAYAQFNLGGLFENGLGVPKDLALARAWYEKSAAQGNEEAAQALARLRK